MTETVDEVFKNEIRISDSTANPGALGLLAFGADNDHPEHA